MKTAPRPKKKILIVDDHPIMRQGLAMLINHQADFTVCGEAEDAHTALDVIAATNPDLAIVDLSLKTRSGFELIKDIKVLHPGLAMLVLSMHDESIYAERVLRAGARGYLMKQEGAEKVTAAIRHILAGRCTSATKWPRKFYKALPAGGRATATRLWPG